MPRVKFLIADESASPLHNPRTPLPHVTLANYFTFLHHFPLLSALLFSSVHRALTFFFTASMEAKVFRTPPPLHPVHFPPRISRPRCAFAVQTRMPARCSTYCSGMARFGLGPVRASPDLVRYVNDDPLEESGFCFCLWLLVALASNLLWCCVHLAWFPPPWDAKCWFLQKFLLSFIDRFVNLVTWTR